MSREEENFGFWVVMVTFLLASGIIWTMGAISYGEMVANEKWHNRIVNNSDYIATVKSQLLLEKKAKELEESLKLHEK